MFGKYGCDAPLALINATVQAAAQALPDPDFVLITGDYVRHGAHLVSD